MSHPSDKTDLHRDLRHVHVRLGELAALLRPHVTTGIHDPVTAAHHADLRARGTVSVAMDRESIR